MSASAKKKLRKENEAAVLTEKQLKAQRETKKLKIYTSIFVVAIVVVLVAALVFAGINIYRNSGIVQKNTVAAVVGEEELNSVQLSYYYNNVISSTYNEWVQNYGDYMTLFLGLMDLDITKPLDTQQYPDGGTWADYFMNTALEQAKSDYVLYTAANAAGFELPAENELALNNAIAEFELMAMVSGYPDADSYVRAIYGPGADTESYYAYCRNAQIAAAYYNAYRNTLEVDDAAIRAYEADKYNTFSSYEYAVYYLSYNNYLTGGTEGEDGKVVYSDAEKDAARAAAKAEAELLTKATTVEDFDKAIAELSINKDSEGVKSIVYTDKLYASISDIYNDWLADGARKAGDCAVFEAENTVINDDGSTGTEISDYYAVLFLGRNDNTMPLANVRHILVNYKGGTTDATGVTTYSDEEKATAKAEAEAILAELTADGTVTDDEFAAAATEKSNDAASAANGGLYEDITPAEGVYVAEFTDWATDESRKTGDTGIIETSHGYHVMFYVGDDALTYRDYLIREEIRNNEVTAWYDAQLAANVAEIKNISHQNTNIILANFQG